MDIISMVAYQWQLPVSCVELIECRLEADKIHARFKINDGSGGNVVDDVEFNTLTLTNHNLH